MTSPEWHISCPGDYAWTPEEAAQIVRAAQAFRDALPNAKGRLYHRVHVNDVGVLPGNIEVTWPQPVDPKVTAKLEEIVQMYKTGLMSLEDVRRSNPFGDR
jgi:hypothetical protein